jgi:hypothetical protein
MAVMIDAEELNTSRKNYEILSKVELHKHKHNNDDSVTSEG